jgi:RNA polymerase sigma-70 factor (ECF subfamily)
VTTEAPDGPEAPDDRALLGAVADGDAAALRALYDRHAPWLVLRLSRRCADPGLVDEVVQDTFLAVWRKPAGYRGDGPVAAWIWGIGVRRLIDRLRRKPLARLWPDNADADSTATAAVHPAVSAEEQVLLGVEHGDLAGALHRLSPELRAVVQATVLDGLTTREAGRLLGVPAGTVKTRMARARLQLRLHLREELA